MNDTEKNIKEMQEELNSIKALKEINARHQQLERENFRKKYKSSRMNSYKQ